MVFTQGRGFVLGASLGLQIRSLRCRVLVCHAVDTASVATRFLFGKLFCVAITFSFGEKRCRKNLPLCDLNQTMTDPWRNLRIGDRIRITHIPDDYLRPGYTFHDETRALYEHLIARREILTVDEFCEQELPWVSYEQTMPDGEIVSHSLAVNDDSWELVTEN